MIAAIEELLSGAEDVPQEQLPAHFDSLSTQCHALQKFLSDSTLFLTSYELRTSQQVEIDTQIHGEIDNSPLKCT